MGVADARLGGQFAKCIVYRGAINREPAVISLVIAHRHSRTFVLGTTAVEERAKVFEAKVNGVIETFRFTDEPK